MSGPIRRSSRLAERRAKVYCKTKKEISPTEKDHSMMTIFVGVEVVGQPPINAVHATRNLNITVEDQSQALLDKIRPELHRTFAKCAEKEEARALKSAKAELKTLVAEMAATKTELKTTKAELKASQDRIAVLESMDRICKICCDRELQISLVPCGHLFCKECADKARQHICANPNCTTSTSSCPFCRRSFVSYNRVFFP